VSENIQTGTRSKKGLNATRQLSPILKEEYFKAYKAKQERKPVAWVTVYTPVEILHAMDITPVYPENYAAMCAAKQRSAEFCEAAEREGYSKDLCSYFRSNLGTVLTKQSVLKHDMAAPDLLIATTCLCDAHLKWFETLSRVFNCPLFFLDAPYNKKSQDYDQLDKEYVNYYVDQVKDLIIFLEQLTSTRLDWNRLENTIELSDQASMLWEEICELRKAVPSPMSAVDTFSDIALLITQPGNQLAVDFFTRLRDEVKALVAEGKGVIPNEKYRIWWDMVPMWYDMGLFNYLESKGAVVAAEYFNLGWASRLDAKKPLESLARKYITSAWGNSPLDRKFDRTLKFVQDYKIDGALIFSNWGCRPYCIGQLELQKVLKTKLNIPSLIIDGDIADPRVHSEKPLLTRLDAFLESIQK